MTSSPHRTPEESRAALADPAVAQKLEEYGLDERARLGEGGEAIVYALDRERVLRVHRAGPERETIVRRASLLDELAAAAPGLPFGVPRVLDVTRVNDHWFTVEPRWPGRTLSVALKGARGAQRAALLRSYLDSGKRLSQVAWSRPFYGDLLVDDAIRCASFHAYLEARARRSLGAAGPPLSTIDARAIADALPPPERPTFVYIDLHPDNVLVEGEQVTAIIDFGSAVIVGEPRFGAVIPVTYLDDDDQPLGAAWLHEQGWDELFDPVRRWVAAFWSFASDDVRLFTWCWSTLLAERGGELQD